MDTITPPTKLCRKCGRELPISEFYVCRQSKDGLQSYCKSCKLEKPRKPTPEGLAAYQPRELIAELRRRGYVGDLYFKQHIKV